LTLIQSRDGSGSIGRREPLRHDALKTKPAGVLEDGGAVFVGVFIEDDPGGRSHQ
jgi:hypothetical protein